MAKRLIAIIFLTGLVFVLCYIGQSHISLGENRYFLNRIGIKLGLVSNDKQETQQETQQDRLRHVREWCRTHYKLTKGSWEGVESCIVNKDRKVLYCPITKVGCTSWKVAMLVSTDIFKRNYPDLNINDVGVGTATGPDVKLKVNVHSGGLKPFQLTLISDYPINKRANLFKDYFKFMFVREPFDRLLSAYREKLESTIDGKYSAFREANLHDTGKKIIQRYRKNATQYLLKSGRTVTFNEFLQFINDEVDNGYGLNVHWRPYTKAVNPCAFEFDFIGRKETWDEDVNFVMPKLFPNDSYENFPKKNINPARDSTKMYYDTVDPNLIKNIAEKFANDFEVYGYDPYKYIK